LENDSKKLATIGFEEKRAYLTFFEELALLHNSGLIRADVIYYMFGYYAVKCLDSENFWSDIKKSELYWGIFLCFARQMKSRLEAAKRDDIHNVAVGLEPLRF
jgi:hypothetical protein